MAEDVSANSSNSSVLYDLPPSYEEAQGLTSPHRYCEIDDILNSSSDQDKGAVSNNESFEAAESPIYVEIEDIKTPETKQQISQQPSTNVTINYSKTNASILEFITVKIKSNRTKLNCLNHSISCNQKLDVTLSIEGGLISFYHCPHFAFYANFRYTKSNLRLRNDRR